jgi:DNA-binding response OmpR family regulator
MAPRLLIIDDEPDICDFIRDVAAGEGYDVTAANRAEDFKAAFAGGEADVIVLDLTLPGTDGIELLNYLAAVGTRARILIVSGYDESIRRMAFTIGAARGLDMVGVLPKPVRVADLRGLLARFKREAEGAPPN